MHPPALLNGSWWWLAAAGLAAGLLIALVWYFRRMSLRRLPAPGFFLIALAIHVLLGVGSFYVYLDEGGAGAEIRREFRQLVVTTRMSLETLRRSFTPPDDGFDRVSDPKSVQTEDIPAGPADSPPPGPALPSDLAPSGPLPRRLPAARIVAAPEDAVAVPDFRPFPRRQMAAAADREAIPLEPLRGAAETAEDRVEGVAVSIDRRPARDDPAGPLAIPAGPLSAAVRPSGRGSSVGTTTERLPEEPAPPPLAEIPPLKRALHPVEVSLPEARAEMLAVPSTGGAGVKETAPENLPAAVRVEVAVRRGGTGSDAAAGAGGLPIAGMPSAPPIAPPGPRTAAGQGLPPATGRDGFGEEIERQIAAIGPPAGEITRRALRPPSLHYAGENIGLQAMFSHRQGEMKREAASTLGGSGESLEAVRRGLEWIAGRQHADGYWSLHAFYNPEPGKKYTGQGNLRSDAAATGFALLPLLGDGNTHQAGPYQSAVRRGIDWLRKRRSPKGELSVGESGNSRMYAHAIATIALCEDYGMTRDPELREPAQGAIDFILAAQHAPSGGWRYQPNMAADTSVVGWQVMALKSGQMAGLEVRPDRLELVKKWLASVEGTGSRAGQFGYQNNRDLTPAMTAEALLCLQYLGTRRDDSRLQAGAKYLLQHLPKKGSETSYYWYYGTQMMYHLQGPPWEQWNAALRDLLVKTQIQEGPMAGTWDPKDRWESQAGRLYATSLRLLMLEVYYRHLPLYQVLEQ